MDKEDVIGVLGFGEIGRSWAQLYEPGGCEHRDVGDAVTARFPETSVLHVAIPFSDDFEDTVSGVVAQLPRVRLVLIHTTCAVGTTRRLVARHAGLTIVHNPVRGNHPDLAEGIRLFENFIGAVDPAASAAATAHLHAVGVARTHACLPEESELAKLACTSAYGVNIAFAFALREVCDRTGLDFDVVYGRWTHEYNRGYASIGRPEVHRPVLRVARAATATIGGHCVVPNAACLAAQFSEFRPVLMSIAAKDGRGVGVVAGDRPAGTREQREHPDEHKDT